jgi:hypothetical protein
MTQAPNDLFKQINNAVLDLQAADLQHFQRPLRTLGRLLSSPELEAINQGLTEGLDLKAFLDESKRSQGSMVGSAQLAWPDDERQVLGLTLLLLKRLGENPEEAIGFSHDFYYAGRTVVNGIHAMTRQLIIPFVRDYRAHVGSVAQPRSRRVQTDSNKVFIVHGHDGEAREAVARFLERLGFDAVILHEQASRGRTIIEKVEANSDVSFAVILLTPDDEGCSRGGTPEPRARQNVLLELGYFIGLLGRDRVCALKRGDLVIPSDFAGVVWENMDASNGWKQALGRELEAAGHAIDWNLVMRS